MSALEAVRAIISEPKYYIGVYEQSTASRIVKRILEGRATINKRDEFISAFGYVREGDKWIKTE